MESPKEYTFPPRQSKIYSKHKNTNVQNMRLLWVAMVSLKVTGNMRAYVVAILKNNTSDRLTKF